MNLRELHRRLGEVIAEVEATGHPSERAALDAEVFVEVRSESPARVVYKYLPVVRPIGATSRDGVLHFVVEVDEATRLL